MAPVPNVKSESGRDPRVRRAIALVVAPSASVLVGIAVVVFSPKDTTDKASSQFIAYPAEERFRGKPKKPILVGFNIPGPYRPFIAIEARNGPNFAGAYTVVPYELPNRVVKVLVISARTGMAYRAPNATGYIVKYKLDSRLLIYRADSTKRIDQKTKFFVFRRTQFVEVKEGLGHVHH